jgi:hypothetical protein
MRWECSRERASLKDIVVDRVVLRGCREMSCLPVI